MNFLQSDKAIKLFIVLAGFFITNAVLAEFIGVKIFSLEQSLGIQAVSFSFFGFGPLSFNLTAGVLLWPIVFTLTDILNEYFGIKGVRFLSYLAVTLICFWTGLVDYLWFNGRFLNWTDTRCVHFP